MGMLLKAYGALLVVVLAACGDNLKPPVSIGGTVTGLAGTGLVLRNNGGDDVEVSADGTFMFATMVANGATYDVTVAHQPEGPTQTCVVTNGSGVVTSDEAITNVTATCMTNAFTIGGTVTGLTGSGLVLQNNGGDDLSITADGAFTFATPVASGSVFTVSVKTQPANPTQTCTVSGGAGTVGTGNVTTVVVDCAVDRFTVGGMVTGLSGSVVLQNNGGDDITVTSNGSFAFPTTVASGATYAVTVLTQPSSPISQTCTVTAGTGTVTNANVTSVLVDCTTNTFTIGGTVSGLLGTGLILQNNGGDDLAISADGSFTFNTPIASGTTYAVTVLGQPTGPSQTCVVTNDTGTVGGANVTDVTVTCTTNKYTIGGSVTGLAGMGLVLQNNGGDDLMITADGMFTFATPIDSGTMFDVTVLTPPSSPTQDCTVSGGTGTVGGGNVTSVMINCTTSSFTVGGMVSGLVGTGLVLQNNGGDDLMITSNGSFAFATPILSGTTYAVTVLTNPTAPKQTCMVTAGTGTVGGGNVTSVVVVCTTDAFTLGGTVSGLLGNNLHLRNNGGDDLTVNANGMFTFATPVPNGQMYNVTVASGPTPAQSCTVTNGSGTMPTNNVTNVIVSCSSCGNGIVDVGEQCDDGNVVGNDACSNTCTRGAIYLGGSATAGISTALGVLGEPFTAGNAATNNGTFIYSNDGGTAFIDFTAHLNAGAHVIVVGGSALSAYGSWASTYVNHDSQLSWHQSSDCVTDWIKGTAHPITQFLPATFEFTNPSVSFHMLHFLASQPAGGVLLGNTCHGANPGILYTRRYPSGGTFTYLALDPGQYATGTDITGFTAPFLRGVLAYVRGPH